MNRGLARTTCLLVVAVLALVLSGDVTLAGAAGSPRPPTRDLVAEFQMNGNGQDVSGRGHHAQVNGAAPAADRFGRPNGALSFDGVDDCLEVAPHNDFDARPSVTVSVWMKRMEPAANAQLVRQGDFGAGGYRFGLLLHGGGTAPGTSAYSGGAWQGAVDGNALPANEWQHLVAAFDTEKGEIALFVNGRETARKANARMAPVRGQPIVIGAEYYQRKRNGLFRGLLDDIRIYARALSAEEVRDLYAFERRPPQELRKDLTPAETKAFCDDLAGDNAEKAEAAVWPLIGGGDKVLPALAERFKAQPAGPDDAKIAALIRQLDDDAWARREAASEALKAMGKSIEGRLRRELAETKSSEVRWRIEAILQTFAGPSAPSPQEQRLARLRRVLEGIGTPAAKEMMKQLCP